MKKELLTVLGCSGSLAIALATTNPAQANTNLEYVFTASESENQELADIPTSETDYPWYDCTCSEYGESEIEQLDREGDKAIELYGCDCAGCRNLIRQLS